MATSFLATYPIARYGLATNFAESEVPVTFALRFRNRFINSAGGAEKRQGMSQLGSTLTSTPEVTGLHELVDKNGTAILFATCDNGTLHKLSGSTWTMMYSGFTANTLVRSVQMGEKLIFYNGVDRNVYTKDGTTFEELRAIVSRGTADVSASAAGIDDSDVTDWVTQTDTATNDLVRNITKGAYGLITAVTTAQCTHTVIGSGGTGLGQATGNQGASDRYEIIDTVALNIIPAEGEEDNVAVAGPGTSPTVIAVSGVDMSATDVRAGDFVSNTTRNAVAMVSSISGSNLIATSIAGQTAGDSLVFLKSAMPITKAAHVHFGRMYALDARDQRKIRITGKNNPEDMTTDAGTLDSNTLEFAGFQPRGDILMDMGSFQRFFVAAGKNNVFFFEGTDPIEDVSADTRNFDIVGVFPQGVVSPRSVQSIGNDLAFVTRDGVQTAQLVRDSSTLSRTNIAEAIKNVLRDEIGDASEDDIQLIHYPRRAWMLLKVGSQIYVFNYSSYLGDTSLVEQVSPEGTLAVQKGSWSVFDGKCARQTAYLVRSNGDLVCGGAGGKVYTFDADNVFTDDGEVFTTEYRTGWLNLSEPKKDIRIKDIKYIKPILEAGAAITYNISVEGDFGADASETIEVSTSGGAGPIGLATIPFKIGGSSLVNRKYGLRSRGERHRITIRTEDGNGPDIISQFTLYGNRFGVR